MTSIRCIVWGISGPLLEKIKKDTLFQGHALHSALWKWRIKGGPEAGDQFLLILHSHISRICRLSYVSNLFSTLVWDFNVLFNFFFPVITTFVLYSAKREAPQFCHSLAKLVN